MRLVDWKDEPGWDEDWVISGFRVNCLATPRDYTIIALTPYRLGRMEVAPSGMEYQFVVSRDTAAVEVAVRRLRSRWVITGKVWAPMISPAAAKRNHRLVNQAVLDSLTRHEAK